MSLITNVIINWKIFGINQTSQSIVISILSDIRCLIYEKILIVWMKDNTFIYTEMFISMYKCVRLWDCMCNNENRHGIQALW